MYQKDAGVRPRLVSGWTSPDATSNRNSSPTYSPRPSVWYTMVEPSGDQLGAPTPSGESVCSYVRTSDPSTSATCTIGWPSTNAVYAIFVPSGEAASHSTEVPSSGPGVS